MAKRRTAHPNRCRTAETAPRPTWSVAPDLTAWHQAWLNQRVDWSQPVRRVIPDPTSVSRAFLAGMGSVIDLTAATRALPRMRPPTVDVAALCRDWMVVGEDMRRAAEKFNAEILESRGPRQERLFPVDDLGVEPE